VALAGGVAVEAMKAAIEAADGALLVTQQLLNKRGTSML